MSFIVYKDVHKAFAGKPVLRGMNLEIAKGEVMFIIGTSGVGKSVTIKHLIGLLRIDAGRSGSTASASISCPSASSRACAAGSAWCSRARRCSTR